MNELEGKLKIAYNSYIDSLVAYLGDIKQGPTNLQGEFDKALPYILDNSFEVGLRNSYELVRSGSIEKLLSKKVI